MSLAIVRSNSLLLRGPRYKGGAHTAATSADGWGCDGTVCDLAEINRGNIIVVTVYDEAKESDTVRADNWRIARETLELAYIWDRKRVVRTEIVDDGNSVEYI